MDVLGVDVDVGLVRILLHGGVVEVHYLLLEFYRTGAITLLFLCSSDCLMQRRSQVAPSVIRNKAVTIVYAT